MSTSASIPTVLSPIRSSTGNTRKSSSRRAFDTVETRFFTEGDELSQPVPNENEWDEVTELVPRPKSKRKLVIGIAAAAVLLLTLALLIF